MSIALLRKNSPNSQLQNSPIFFWAIHFLLGVAFALKMHWAFFIPIAALFFLTKRKVQGLIFLLTGYFLTLFHYPSLDIEHLEGQGIFQLESISPSQSPFSRALSLKGRFLQFESSGNIYSNLPCTFFQQHPPKEKGPWIIEGALEKKRSFQFTFKPRKNIPWKSLNSSFSWAIWRYQNKETLRQYFEKTCKNPKVAHFFSALSTGDVNDRLLSMEFQKVGLGHILAISGFHFALLAAMLGGTLTLFFLKKIAYPILLGLLSLTLIFLGFSPSILRAYIMIALFILGRMLHRPVDGLNLLGVALLIELCVDPLSLAHVGFQLSFLATFGILAFYRPLNALIHHLLPKRPFFILKKMSRFDQHGYLLSSMLRQSLALNIAVLFATLPTTLYVFHQFSWISIPYNFVLPPLLGISLALLPYSILLPPLKYLNAVYTGWLLELIAHPPELLNFKIFLNNFPFPVLIALLTAIGFLGLRLRHQPG